MIISLQLDEQEKRLLDVLWQNEQEIVWTLVDLKGFNPSLCIYQIFLEEDSRPIMEAQRRLNPKVKEEIHKWLNTEIIYLIFYLVVG